MPQDERDKYQKARESRPNPAKPKGGTTGSKSTPKGARTGSSRIRPTTGTKGEALGIALFGDRAYEIRPMPPQGAQTGSSYAKTGKKLGGRATPDSLMEGIGGQYSPPEGEGGPENVIQDPGVQTLLHTTAMALMEALSDETHGSAIAASGQPKEFEKELSMIFGGGTGQPSIDASILSDPDFFSKVAQNAVKATTPDEKEAQTAKEGVLGEAIGTTKGTGMTDFGAPGGPEPSEIAEDWNSRYARENKGPLLASNIGTAMSLLGALLGSPGLAAGGMALTGAGERRIKDWTRQWNIQAKAAGDDSGIQGATSSRALSDFKTRFSKRLGVLKGEKTELDEKEKMALAEKELAGYTNMSDADREAARQWAPTADPDMTTASSTMNVEGLLGGGKKIEEAESFALKREIIADPDKWRYMDEETKRGELSLLIGGKDTKYPTLEMKDALPVVNAALNEPVSKRETAEMTPAEKAKAYTPDQKFFMDLLGFGKKEHITVEIVITKDLAKENVILNSLGPNLVQDSRKLTLGEFGAEAADVLKEAIEFKPVGKDKYMGEATLDYAEGSEPKGGLWGKVYSTAKMKAPIRVFKADFPFIPKDEGLDDLLERSFREPKVYFTQDFLEWLRIETERLRAK